MALTNSKALVTFFVRSIIILTLFATVIGAGPLYGSEATKPDLLSLAHKIVEGRDGSKYFIQKYLGRGDLTAVYEVSLYKDSRPQRLPVLKIFLPRSMSTDGAHYFQNIMTSIDNYRLVQKWNSKTGLLPTIYKVPVTLVINHKRFPAVLMERSELTLEQVLEQTKNIPDPTARADSMVETCYRMLRDLIPLLMFFEDHGYIHNDIKTKNIMIRNSGMFTIPDLGSLTPIENSHEQLGRLGSSRGQKILGFPSNTNDFSVLAGIIMQSLYEVLGESSSPFAQGLLTFEERTLPISTDLKKVLFEDDNATLPLESELRIRPPKQDISPLMGELSKSVTLEYLDKLETLKVFMDAFLIPEENERVPALITRLLRADKSSMEYEVLSPLSNLRPADLTSQPLCSLKMARAGVRYKQNIRNKEK